MLLPYWKEEEGPEMISSGTDPDAARKKQTDGARKGGRAPVLVRKPSRTDNALYAAGLIILAAGLAFGLFQAFAPDAAMRLRWPLPCPFDSLLHIPCLGCGATRALRALLSGRVWESFLWHPAVPFFAAELLAFMISQTAGRVSRGRIHMLTFSDVYIYALLAVLLLQWAFKLLTGWRP